MQEQDRFKYSKASEMVRNRIAIEISHGRSGMVLSHIDRVTENIYRTLPSGDYGRGDVKRVILAMIGENQ